MNPSPFAAATDARAARFDIYAPIHKALRMFMTDTLQRVGRMDLHDARDLQAALAQLESLLDGAERHLRHENAFVHPAVERHAEGGSHRLAAEHEAHLQAIAALREGAAALRADPTPAAAHRLYRQLASFVAENFEHMEIEESSLNRALWAAYDDAALQALEGRILASIDAQEMSVWLRWLIPALSPAERASLIGGMPPEARAPALEAARALLDAAAWAKLRGALAPLTAVA